MQIKLLKPMNPHYKALEQILVNRNIPYEECCAILLCAI